MLSDLCSPPDVSVMALSIRKTVPYVFSLKAKNMLDTNVLSKDESGKIPLDDSIGKFDDGFRSGKDRHHRW